MDITVTLMKFINHSRTSRFVWIINNSSYRKRYSGKMDSSSEEEGACNLPQDEVREIKRAMRVANARKQALAQQMKTKLDRTSADQYEMESIIRKQSAELSRAKTLLAQAEYDLKETRFEMNQSLERESKLKEERKLLETKGNETISDLKAQLERKTRLQDERSQVGVFECDKLIKTISSLYKSVFDSRNNTTIAPKTTKQLLDKVMNDAEHLREFLRSKSASLMSEEQENVSSLQRQHHIINVESGCDNALLDMCRSLEEENRALSENIETLRTQLADTSRDASINRLIPHYRLAIVRSRTYAANLLEQIKREQATSQTLREQLDATYGDLKKVVEEKRALYTRMSKYSLQLEERDSYLAHQRAVDEEAVLKTSNHNTVRRSPHTYSEEVPISSTDQDSIHSETEKMPVLSQSKYLRSHIEDSIHNQISSIPLSSSATALRHSGNTTTGSTSTGSSGNIRVPETSESEGYNPPKTTSNRASLDLKSELNQLDSEIEELKQKLGKAAMLKSQRILNDVLTTSISGSHN